MSDSARDLERELLSLPRRVRARLAERLLASLDAGSDSDADEMWLREAERRLEALESGAEVALDADQVLERVRSSLR